MSEVVLTAKEREIIDTWNVSPFTSGYIERWVNCNDNVVINTPAALMAIEAKGFYCAVRAAVRQEEQNGPVAMTGFIEEQDCRRPCYCDGRRALFHRFVEYKNIVPPSMLAGGHNGGQISVLYALIEYEDGHVCYESPESITFADGGGFEGFAFLPKEPGIRHER